MKKNIKRYLSYVLGVILAMGLGLSYAYAVGANDSNAFVTTTEWETKVAQIEASLDNVTKTINDTNMDFMLNGPRLQASMIEGLENMAMRSPYFAFFINSTNPPNSNDLRWPRQSGVYLSDTWNGMQQVSQQNYGTGSVSDSMSGLVARYACKTNTPNYYVIISFYNYQHTMIHYCSIGKGQQENPITAKNLTFELPLDEWRMYDNTAVTTVSRRTDYQNCGAAGWYGLSYRTSNSDGCTSTGSAVSRTVDTVNNKIIFTAEFPANCYAIKVYALSVFGILNTNMAGKKYAGPNDTCHVNPAYAHYYVGKVYSPQKGCLSLKTYLNGEIPILNE